MNLYNEFDRKADTLVFEQYKLYVESADKISSNRLIVFNIFVTLHSGTFVGVVTTLNDPIKSTAFGFLGIILCIFGFLLLKAYRNLNQQKYKQICRIEEQLPIRLFSCEWEKLKHQRHVGFSVLELGFFAAFLFLYLFLIGFSAGIHL